MISIYTEVRLVFDRYISDSFKIRTRRKRTSRKGICYKILDSTNISSISLKSLLQHIDAKQDLPVYLAKKSKSRYEAVNQQYKVTYDRISESDIESFLDVMKMHDHEEADTLLIPHCFSIARRVPFTIYTVYLPDTDVFLLLMHFPTLSQSVLAATRREDSQRSQKNFGGKNFTEYAGCLSKAR